MVGELVPAAKNIKHDVLDVTSVYITVFQAVLDFCFLHIQLDFQIKSLFTWKHLASRIVTLKVLLGRLPLEVETLDHLGNEVYFSHRS